MRPKILAAFVILLFAGCGGSGGSGGSVSAPSSVTSSNSVSSSGSTSVVSTSQPSQKLALKFPLACVLWQDCYISAFPDIDGDGKDAFCGNDTYSGHTGTDFSATWARMDIGLNTLSAHDGEVLFAFDGKYDRCTSDATDPDCLNPVSPRRAGLNEGNTVCSDMGNYCGGSACYFCASAGNYIVIRHNSSVATLYGHLAKGSVTVKAGDSVLQGQAIGRLGSSGASNGPHLHFEVLDSSLKSVDPWYGSCNATLKESLWIDQMALY